MFNLQKCQNRMDQTSAGRYEVKSSRNMGSLIEVLSSHLVSRSSWPSETAWSLNGVDKKHFKKDYFKQNIQQVFYNLDGD